MVVDHARAAVEESGQPTEVMQPPLSGLRQGGGERYESRAASNFETPAPCNPETLVHYRLSGAT
jgi:hypothetical protein